MRAETICSSAIIPELLAAPNLKRVRSIRKAVGDHEPLSTAPAPVIMGGKPGKRSVANLGQKLFDLGVKRFRLMREVADSAQYLPGNISGFHRNPGHPDDIRGNVLGAGRGLFDVLGDFTGCFVLLVGRNGDGGGIFADGVDAVCVRDDRRHCIGRCGCDLALVFPDEQEIKILFRVPAAIRC